MCWLLTMFCLEFGLKREDACFDFASSSLRPELYFRLFRYHPFFFFRLAKFCGKEIKVKVLIF